MSQYVEITIANNSGSNSPINDSSLYISLYAGGTPYAIDLSTGICTAGTDGNNAVPTLFSSLTNKVLKLDASTQMASGRLYLSSSDTPIASGGPSITDCPDYFDWLEFTMNGPSVSSKQFVINTTQVDQFGFPITISGMTPADPAFGSTAGSNPSITRAKVLSEFSKISTEYQDCLLPNAATPSNPDLRILSPGNAIVNKPTSDLGSVFDDALKTFFMQSPTGPKSAKSVARTIYIDSVSGYPYIGNITTVSETGTDGKTYNYPVIQFNYAGATAAPNPLGIAVPPPSGSGPYNIYFPFFNTNAGNSFPPPPYWWKPKAGQNGGSLATGDLPSQMVFAASGVFADNAFQSTAPGSFYTTLQQQIIGNLENQINVAFNRGYANSSAWITLTGTIASSGSTKNSSGLYETTVTLGSGYTNQNLPNTTANLAIGMQVLSYASSQPLEILKIINATSFTITSAKEILAQNPQYLTFSNFYQGSEANNAYANFFHQSAISIGGRAYAMPFDDQGGFSSTLTSNWTSTPSKLTITLGAWS